MSLITLIVSFIIYDVRRMLLHDTALKGDCLLIYCAVAW